MRRAAPVLLAMLLAAGACSTESESSRVARPGDLTVANAALVASVAANAPDAKVRELVSALGEAGLGVEQVSYADPPMLLVAFRADSTVEQRRGLFAKLADSRYFSSIQCSSCSAHPQRPPGTPAR